MRSSMFEDWLAAFLVRKWAGRSPRSEASCIHGALLRNDDLSASCSYEHWGLECDVPLNSTSYKDDSGYQEFSQLQWGPVVFLCIYASRAFHSILHGGTMGLGLQSTPLDNETGAVNRPLSAMTVACDRKLGHQVSRSKQWNEQGEWETYTFHSSKIQVRD